VTRETASFKLPLRANVGIGCVNLIWTYDSFVPRDRASRRAQLSIRHGRRNYDRSIAGLGTGKTQRYVASDFDQLSDHLFDPREIAAVEAVTGSVQHRSTARAQLVQQCSTRD
jgi:hypothetical protein